jgi:hypothetical protein
MLKVVGSLRGGTHSWAWWYTPVIPALRKAQQEDCKFEASLDYIVRPCLKTTTITKQNQN